MTDKSFYFGRGTPEMFDDYMDFINYVFGFNDDSSNFKKLLPKLYKYEYEPAVSSYVVLEDGKMKAAIGAFDHDISVGGVYLKTRGIGNVAVHPDARGSGYMKKLMNMALDDMVSEGVVLSVLGGRRQRYNYFSYDKLGQAVSMSFNSDNIRHTFGKDRKHTIKFKQVEDADYELLEQIKSLSESQPFYALRDSVKYFEIISSWHQVTYAGFENDRFIGYAIAKGNDVNEMLIKENCDVTEFVCALYDYLGASTMQIKLPAFLTKYIEKLYRICEFYDTEPCKSFSVLNYKDTVLAFMRLKATYADMPDGSLILDVDGRAGREIIKIAVCDGAVSVEYTDEEADLSLSHLDAMNLLFASVCPIREKLPTFARLWFPLPIYLYSSDAV